MTHTSEGAMNRLIMPECGAYIGTHTLHNTCDREGKIWLSYGNGKWIFHPSGESPYAPLFMRAGGGSVKLFCGARRLYFKGMRHL